MNRWDEFWTSFWIGFFWGMKWVGPPALALAIAELAWRHLRGG